MFPPGQPWPPLLLLSRIELLGIELAQDFELVIGRRLGYSQVLRVLDGKAGIVLQLFARHARIKRYHLHTPVVAVKPENCQIRDDAEHAAREKSPRLPGVAAA